MTEEQKQRVASLQIGFLALQAKIYHAQTVNERDGAIRIAIIRLMAEPDKEVRETFMRWQAHRMDLSVMFNTARLDSEGAVSRRLSAL